MEEDILNNITRKVKSNTPGGLLSQFFRQILMELGYSPARFSRRLNDFVAINNARAKTTSYITTINRSHVLRKLASDNFTWKNFILGIFQFLNVKKMEIKIILHHNNGEKTSHQMTMVNTNILPNGDDNE
jgi:hypothetical protein